MKTVGGGEVAAPGSPCHRRASPAPGRAWTAGLSIARHAVCVACGFFCRIDCADGADFTTGLKHSTLTPPSDISGLPYLLHQGELLSLRDPHKWILRPILGLGRDRYGFPSYDHCWLVITPGVLISGHIVVGVIFSGRKGGYL